MRSPSFAQLLTPFVFLGVIQVGGGCASASGENSADPAITPASSESPALPGAPAADSATQVKETAREGTRLRARYATHTIAGDDGSRYTSRSFAGWVDTTRNEPCSPQVASDGKTRCYPQSVPLPYYGSETLFSDDACKNRNVASISRQYMCTTPAYIQASDTSGKPAAVCSFNGPALRKVGRTVTRGYRLDEKSACVEKLIPESSVAFEMSDVIPASEFVLFTETTEDK